MEEEEAFLATGMLSCCSAAEKVILGAEGQERECSLDCSLGAALCNSRGQEGPWVHMLGVKGH